MRNMHGDNKPTVRTSGVLYLGGNPNDCVAMRVLVCVAVAALTARAGAMPALAPTTTTSSSAPDGTIWVWKPNKVDTGLHEPEGDLNSGEGSSGSGSSGSGRADAHPTWEGAKCFTNEWEPFVPPFGGVCVFTGKQGYVRCEKKAEVGASAAPCVYWCTNSFFNF